MKNQYIKPPKTPTRPDIQFDNFSLIPASLLPDLRVYQALSDRQSKGTAVLVLPSPTSPLRRVYAAVARVLRENGKSVKLYSPG